MTYTYQNHELLDSIYCEFPQTQKIIDIVELSFIGLGTNKIPTPLQTAGIGSAEYRGLSVH